MTESSEKKFPCLEDLESMDLKTESEKEASGQSLTHSKSITFSLSNSSKESETPKQTHLAKKSLSSSSALENSEIQQRILQTKRKFGLRKRKKRQMHDGMRKTTESESKEVPPESETGETDSVLFSEDVSALRSPPKPSYKRRVKRSDKKTKASYIACFLSTRWRIAVSILVPLSSMVITVAAVGICTNWIKSGKSDWDNLFREADELQRKNQQHLVHPNILY